MSAVPTPPTIGSAGALPTTQLNQFTDSINFLLGPPLCRVYAVSTQSIPNNTWTSLGFGAESVDQSPDGTAMHDNVTNQSRITVSYSGWWLPSGTYATAANSSGRRGVCLGINGTKLDATASMIPTASSGVIVVPLTGVPVYLAVGDYAQLMALQDSGGALSTTLSNESTSQFSLTFLSR